MRPSSCRTRLSAAACLPASTRRAPPSTATSCAIRRATLSNSRFEPDAPGTCRATTSYEEVEMPPRGVKKGTKLAREYEHIKESELGQGRSEGRAEEIAPLEDRHVLEPARRPTLRHEPPEGADARAALQRGPADGHRGPLVDEQ